LRPINDRLLEPISKNKQGYSSRHAGIQGVYKDNYTLFGLYSIQAVKIIHIY